MLARPVSTRLPAASAKPGSTAAHEARHSYTPATASDRAGASCFSVRRGLLRTSSAGLLAIQQSATGNVVLADDDAKPGGIVNTCGSG